MNREKIVQDVYERKLPMAEQVDAFFAAGADRVLLIDSSCHVMTITK
jgi:hypothetical protein